MKNKVIHISHIDLDGYGCLVLMKKMFRDLYNLDVDYLTVNYGFEDDMSLDIMSKLINYDIIMFTDISFSKEFAMKLNTLRNTYGKSIILLDHHESAISNLSELNYDWIKLDSSKCGTLLCYEYAQKVYESFNRLNEITPWKEFSEVVNDYDLWIHNTYNSTLLQFLWSSMDKVEFIDRFVGNPSLEFTPEEKDIIKVSEDILNESIEIVENNIEYYTDITNRRFGLAPKTKFYSLVSDRILKSHDIDYLVLRDGSNLSFRSITTNVLPICESIGGGGHKLACGATVDPLVDVVNSIINREIIMYEFLNKFSNF